MKKDLVKYRSLTTHEIVWSYTHWSPKVIDGIDFIPVTLVKPSQDRTLQLYYMKKDFLEEVK
jgi:hypothetical protein